MFKLWCISQLFFLYFALNAAVKLSTLVPLESSPATGITTIAAFLPIEDLYGVSTSVLEAENWLRTNVLAHYPATNITTILVGHSLLCQKNQERSRMSLILPSTKNIYYSLTRWGLHTEIKVSTSFSSNCLVDQDMAEQYVKPLLEFLEHVNAPYVVSTTSDLDEKIESLVNSHLGSVKKLGNFSLNKIFLIDDNPNKIFLIDENPNKIFLIDENPNKIFLINDNPRQGRPLSRKLSAFDSKYTFPTRPTPLAPNPNHAPAFAANSPLPPLVGTISPPFAPEMAPPLFNPVSPSYGPHLPPCIPSHGGGGVPAAAPATGGSSNGLWCVAKPSVPPETLQEALDYACGEGDADCEAISPSGSCYYPDTIVAHASYAFNSYWQKTKSIGGTCGFGGTAMLINTDPSYLHCRFILA